MKGVGVSNWILPLDCGRNSAPKIALKKPCYDWESPYKKGVPCRCRTGTLKNLRNAYGVGSPTVGTTSSSVRMHICAVTYITEISLHLTLNTNQLKLEFKNTGGGLNGVPQ